MVMLTEFEDPTKGRVVIQRPKKDDPSTIETVIYDNDTKQETVVGTMHNPHPQPVHISPIGSNLGQRNPNQSQGNRSQDATSIGQAQEASELDIEYYLTEFEGSTPPNKDIDIHRVAREDEVLGEIELILMTTGIAVGVTAVAFLARFPYLLWNPSLYASALALSSSIYGKSRGL